MSSDKPHYIGRYAPSPTGRLHLGNLRTALLAWLHARLHQGEFLLRFDDLDSPRVVVGSEQQIISDLTWLGLDWDGDIYRQSEYLQHYQATLDALSERGLSYPCFCSRKDIQQSVSAPHGATPVYPGFCKNLSVKQQHKRAQDKQASTRLRVEDVDIEFVDGFAGQQTQSLMQECGDFVIKRADGLFAYQFAVVIDDIAQGVTDVVRGEDLLDSSARQIYVFQQCGKHAPNYWHVPLLMDSEGKRMAKRDGSDSISEWQQNGRTVEQLIAYLATSLGLVSGRISAISAKELLEELTPLSLKKSLKAALSKSV